MGRVGKCCGCAGVHKCCQACADQTPGSWRLTIDGELRELRPETVTITNEAVCQWSGRWLVPFTIGDCVDSVVRLEFAFHTTVSPAGSPYYARFSAYDADGTLLAEWRTDAFDSFNCTQSVTLQQVEIDGGPGDCGTLADITVTPYGWTKCCCAPACSSGTPHAFLLSVTVDSLVMPVQTLTINWAPCEVGLPATWSATIPTTTILGCTVDRAFLEIANMTGGVGWKVTLYSAANPSTDFLAWQSPTALASALPVDCTDETTMRLEPIAGGYGPHTEDVAIAAINVKHCEETTSSGPTGCQDACWLSLGATTPDIDVDLTGFTFAQYTDEAGRPGCSACNGSLGIYTLTPGVCPSALDNFPSVTGSCAIGFQGGTCIWRYREQFCVEAQESRDVTWYLDLCAVFGRVSGGSLPTYGWAFYINFHEEFDDNRQWFVYQSATYYGCSDLSSPATVYICDKKSLDAPGLVLCEEVTVPTSIAIDWETT